MPNFISLKDLPYKKLLRSSPFLIIYLAIGITIWLIYYPANMSPDSINQYKQALTGNYSDGHPPIMTFVLRLFMLAGLDIGGLMFFQCMFWLLGLRSLSNSVQRSLANKEPANKEPNVYRMESISLITTLILLSPITPLIYYLMTFWKDCWVAVLFLWICSLSINIFSGLNKTNRTLSNLKLFTLIFLISLTILLRHNLILIYPFYFLILWLILQRKSLKTRVALSIAPLIVYLFFNLVVYQLINIKQTFEGRKVLAFELAGICYHNMDDCKKFPFISQHINTEDIPTHTFTNWKKKFYRKRIFRRKLLTGQNGMELTNEYITGVIIYPHLFLKVKYKSFKELLGMDRTYLWFFDFLMNNGLNIKQHKEYRPIRLKIRKYWFKVLRDKHLRFISGAHIVWMVVNLLLLITVLYKYLKNQKKIYLFYAAGLSIPFFYYFSYFIAVSGSTFRYMYPSTIVMQIIFINLLFYALIKCIGSVYKRLTAQYHNSTRLQEIHS